MKKILLLVLLSAILVSSCEVPSMPQDFDRSGEVMHVTVVYHSSLLDLQDSYAKEFGVRKDGQDGYAVWKNPGNQPYTCEVHVLKPKANGDTAMDALGHEMTHCLLGTFHKE